MNKQFELHFTLVGNTLVPTAAPTTAPIHKESSAGTRTSVTVVPSSSSMIAPGYRLAVALS